jgi:hypothetical protein
MFWRYVGQLRKRNGRRPTSSERPRSTPEFSFEHEIDGVRQATKERAIGYPVAADNDNEIWSALDNHCWPALHFVDADGIIRDHDFGEGRYGEVFFRNVI